MGGGQTSAGSSREQNSSPCGVTAATLDLHYWTISTDQHYSPPHFKSTAIRRDQMVLDEFVIFKMLECLLGSWVGSLQCWWSLLRFFLIYLSVTHLFPAQWSLSYHTCAEGAVTGNRGWLIARFLFLCILQKFVVRQCFYQFLTWPQSNWAFSNQCVFWPTGSIIAALIYIAHQRSEMLNFGPFVHLIALDFSKALTQLLCGCANFCR